MTDEIALAEAVSDGGVIVIGHVNPYWLAHQVGQATWFLHWHDFQSTFRRGMATGARVGVKKTLEGSTVR